MEYTDQDLLRAIAQENEKAFNRLYERYCRLFYNLAFTRTHDRDIADEISQKFWISVWSRPEIIRTDGEKCAKNFLYKYFSFCMSDYLKSAAARILGGNEELLNQIASEHSYTHIMEELSTEDIYAFLNHWVDDMPELTQQIFICRWKNDLSQKETAQELGISEYIVRLHYNSALTFLRRHLKTSGIYPALLIVLLEKLN